MRKKAKNGTAPVQPPQQEDYLPQAIQKAVVQTGLKHPATVYPIALGFSSAVVGVLFNAPVMLAAALALGLAGPLWAVTNIFFRHEAIGSSYLEKLNRQQKQYERGLVQDLETEFEQCSKDVDMEFRAHQGLEQLKGIQEKLANVQELLDMKLRADEITYGRFLGAAEQVALSVLDSLRGLVGVLKSSSSIQPTRVRNRLKKIQACKNPGKEEVGQLKALQERIDLWEEQMQKADQIISRNEQAMTELERVSAAVALWGTDHRFAVGDLEHTIKRLNELAVHAHEYNAV
jgi:hypothetical protein